MNKIKFLSLKLLKHEFISSGLIVLIGTNIYNFSQLIYHFLAGRFLGKVYYGDLASIISILGLISIVQISIGLSIVKYIASEKNEDNIAGFVKWAYKTSVLTGAVVLIISIVLSPWLIDFLQISQPSAVFLLGPLLMAYIVVATLRSVLQGLIRFNKYVISLSIEAGFKLIFTIIFLLFGWATFGALFGLLIGVVLSLFFTKKYISHFLTSKTSLTPDIRPLFKYSLAVFIQGLALTSMYTTDLLLVKHFFSPEEAGIYAAFAILGRIVFYGTSPVTNVMFPIVAKRHLNGEKYMHILAFSAFAVIIFTLALGLIYYLIPSLPILVLYGSGYLSNSNILWWFGLFMGMLSLGMLLTHFYLSVGKTNVVYFFVFAAILQGLMIWFFHSSLLVVVQLSLLSASLLVLLLLVYFAYLYYPRLR